MLKLANHQGLYNGTLDGENNPHGFGSIRYLKGDRFDRFNYTGQWQQGDIGAGGIMYWNNGARSVTYTQDTLVYIYSKYLICFRILIYNFFFGWLYYFTIFK